MKTVFKSIVLVVAIIQWALVHAEIFVGTPTDTLDTLFQEQFPGADRDMGCAIMMDDGAGRLTFSIDSPEAVHDFEIVERISKDLIPLLQRAPQITDQIFYRVDMDKSPGQEIELRPRVDKGLWELRIALKQPFQHDQNFDGFKYVITIQNGKVVEFEERLISSQLGAQSRETLLRPYGMRSRPHPLFNDKTDHYQHYYLHYRCINTPMS